MKEKFLITGSTGFIGANLAHKLVKEKKHVILLVRDASLNWRLTDIAKDVEVVVSDIRDQNLCSVMKKLKPTHIYHLATYGAYPHEEDFSSMIDVNIRGTANLLNACKQAGFTLFVNTSSTSEYGIKDKPMKESDVLAPINDYGITKATATLYCQKEAVRHSIPIITLRLFSTYGPFEAKKRLIPTLIMGALKNQTIELSKPGNVRDYVYVSDIMAAYECAANKNHVPGVIYNIGTGIQSTIKDVADIIVSNIATSTSISWEKIPVQARQMEPKYWVADATKANHLLGWKPKYSLKEGLEETITWFQKNKSLYE